MRPVRSIRVRIHERGDRKLDGIIHLIEEAGRPRPLPDVLASLCQAIAGIARADVVSVYVAERDPADGGVETLVMRANRGFPAEAVGNVRLRLGEGLTGVAAECLRPVSVAVARHDERYKHFPGIGEEKFPSFLAIPLLGGTSGATGVLVLQRGVVREWAPAEVALATALAAPVAYALERARARDAEKSADRDAGPGGNGRGARRPTARAARLEGARVSAGAALGRADVLPSLDGVIARLGTRPVERPGQTVALAFVSLARELGRTRLELEPRLDKESLLPLRSLALLLEDERFRDLLLVKTTALGVGAGLGTVAREYARAPYRVPTGDGAATTWLGERAAEVEDLCLLVGARVLGERVPALGAVLVVERLTAMLALAAVARRAVAAAVGGPASDSALGTTVARAAAMPAVCDVAGLYAWVRPDDRVLVDGDGGLVRVNPPATAVAQFRARRGG
jgi:phosphotransferase system, enzyme I, PtsP